MSNRKIEGKDSREPAEPPFTDAQFMPMPREAGEAEIISRPALTYWQDAMKRLRQDKLAMTCVAIIAMVCLVGVAGPWFFPAEVDGVPYENQQNPNNLDVSPNFGEKFVVTEDSSGWGEDKIAANFDPAAAPILSAGQIPPVTGLKVSQASVNGVVLEWDWIAGVAGYQIYRTVIERDSLKEPDLILGLKQGSLERGIASGEASQPGQVSYTDRMGLDSSERYAYTVVPYIDNPSTFQREESQAAGVVITDLKRTIKLSDAQLLISNVKVGDEIAGRAHPFGTDGLGRDVLARMVQGTRIDMLLALLVPTLAIFLGVLYGAVSGLIGKTTDVIMMRIVEIVDNFPDLLVFILLQVAFGKGLLTLIVALSIFSWAGFARIVRGEVLRLREIEFVQASRLLGAPVMRLVMKHIGPNLLGLIIIAWSSRIPNVIAAEAFLSMLGLGLEQPTPSWGNVVFDAARRLQVNPIQFFLPAAVLGVTLLAFYLLGNSLRDAFDPKLRGRG